MRIGELVAAPRLLLALDFDGTLAPLVNDPSAARALPGIAEMLCALAACPGLSLAVITGRDRDGILPLLSGFPPLWLAVSHGREILEPDQAHADSVPDSRLEFLRRLPLPDGLRREDKAFSCAFHWRGRPEGCPRAWLSETARMAEEAGLERLEGRQVCEFLLPGPGKLAAFSELRSRTASAVVVFAGDDVTDHSAIEYASCHGTGIYVRSEESAWDFPEGILCLDGPEALLEWLQELWECVRTAGKNEASRGC